MKDSFIVTKILESFLKKVLKTSTKILNHARSLKVDVLAADQKETYQDPSFKVGPGWP
jgi:hypothetical protein